VLKLRAMRSNSSRSKELMIVIQFKAFVKDIRSSRSNRTRFIGENRMNCMGLGG
jgi:hypothetical protein